MVASGKRLVSKPSGGFVVVARRPVKIPAYIERLGAKTVKAYRVQTERREALSRAAAAEFQKKEAERTRPRKLRNIGRITKEQVARDRRSSPYGPNYTGD